MQCISQAGLPVPGNSNRPERFRKPSADRSAGRAAETRAAKSTGRLGMAGPDCVHSGSRPRRARARGTSTPANFH
jgi:hypothetical protein